jgi:outer membrane protein TolC
MQFARLLRVVTAFALIALSATPANSQVIDPCPEQRQIAVRDPSEFCPIGLPGAEVPFTVALDEDRAPEPLSLDEAIQIAIRNADVIRVLGGVSASSTGRTIYDVAISNASIDEQLSVFDPTLNLQSTMNKSDNPSAIFDPVNPGQSILTGSSVDSISTTLNLQKRTQTGATVGMNVNAVGSYFEPGVFPLEPQYRSFVEMTLRQPLARGFGRDVNLAPVVIARIGTERSFFQFKNSVQELVRSVIAGYWNLVSARVEVWARKQQIKQAKFAYDRALARKEADLAVAADVAQARSSLANFRASLITARSSVILAETALRNVMGLPPSNGSVFVPTSLPILEQIDFDWNEIVSIAEQHRPDIIELKLVLEADRLQLLQADNAVLPQFDGIANYRWDGLSGEMPNGNFLENDGGRFAGFNLGVNFSVPFGLRQSRAALRRSELVLLQDQKNLDQGIHQMVHQLTINYRNLDQFYLQIEAFREARKAARLSYQNQADEVFTGRREFLNVLTAITDWGNAVSQEARSITQYNTELANVEAQTGSILETHGIRFVEERFGSIAPTLVGVRRPVRDYPKSLRVEGTDDRYRESATNSDSAFELEDLQTPRPDSEDQEDATAEELEAISPNSSVDDDPTFRIKDLKELLEESQAPEVPNSKPSGSSQTRPINSFQNSLSPTSDRTRKRSPRWSFRNIFRR